MGKKKEKEKNYFWFAYETLNSSKQNEFKEALEECGISPRRFVESDSFKPVDEIPPKYSRVYAALLGLPAEQVIQDTFGCDFLARIQMHQAKSYQKPRNKSMTL